jgi:methyl-accepting chemotaxis protein
VPFTVEDFQDLVRLLEQRPEWRAELRRLVLSDELLTLPDIVRALAAAQERTEARLDQLAAAQERTEARLEQLAAAQERTETQLRELGAQVGDLTTEVRQLTSRVDQLASAHLQLVEIQQRMADDIGGLKGMALEEKYRQRASAYFGRLIRRSYTLTD